MIVRTDIDLVGGWSEFWNTVKTTAGIEGLLRFLTMAGVLLIVFAIVKWVWEKRRGGGGNGRAVMWSLIVGIILAGPDLVIPAVLAIVQVVANFFINLIS